MNYERKSVDAAQIRDFATSLLRPASFHPTMARHIEGVAVSSRKDAHGSRWNPMGAAYELPIPLLAAHDFHYPVGWVEHVVKGPNAIRFRARIADSGVGVDEVWDKLKSGEIDAVSVALDRSRSTSAQAYRGDTVFDWPEWFWAELSIVGSGADDAARVHRVREVEVGVVRLNGDRRETVYRDVRAKYRASPLYVDTTPRVVRL